MFTTSCSIRDLLKVLLLNLTEHNLKFRTSDTNHSGHLYTLFYRIKAISYIPNLVLSLQCVRSRMSIYSHEHYVYRSTQRVSLLAQDYYPTQVILGGGGGWGRGAYTILTQP